MKTGARELNRKNNVTSRYEAFPFLRQLKIRWRESLFSSSILPSSDDLSSYLVPALSFSSRLLCSVREGKRYKEKGLAIFNMAAIARRNIFKALKNVG